MTMKPPQLTCFIGGPQDTRTEAEQADTRARWAEVARELGRMLVAAPVPARDPSLTPPAMGDLRIHPTSLGYTKMGDAVQKNFPASVRMLEDE
jgi:hypothetical protein